MAKKTRSTSSGRKKIAHSQKSPKHHILRRHFPTFYEQPMFGVGVLALAIIALILFTATH